MAKNYFSLVLISGSLACSRHSDSRAWTKNCKRKKNEGFSFCACHVQFKVSVKENEEPKEKNSSRASIFATKASYISN